MKKALRISGIVVAALLGLVLIVLAALPLVLNSRAVTKIVDRLAAQYIDGDLEYGRLHVSLYRHFPQVEIRLEDVALTYPHERFSPFDTLPAPSRLLDAGRGAVKDTLARFASLEASVNAWQLLRGEFRIPEVTLDRFAAFAHHYGDTANWSILRLPQSEKEKTGFDLPWIRLGALHISGTPQVVYTAQRDDIYAAARFRGFSLTGDAKLASDRIRLEEIHLALDSLQVFGHIPQDTLSVRLDRLSVDEDGKQQLFDLFLTADALMRTESLGSLTVPVRLDGRLGYGQEPGRTDVGVERLDLRVAQLPLHAEGRATILPEQIDLNASAAVDDLPLDSLLRGWLDRFLQISRNIRTDARLDLKVSANGTYSRESWPHVVARLQVPQSHSAYAPMDLSGELELDLDAEMQPDRRLDARLRMLKARIPGASVRLDGTAADLLGGNARFDLHAEADAHAAPLVQRFVPARLGIRQASGKARLDLRAGVTQQELQTFRFQNADIRGTLRSDSLYAIVPDDTIDARLYRTDVLITSDRNGLRLNAAFDSVYLDKGVQLQARVRDMRNGAQINKVPVREQTVPRMFVSTENGQLFAKLGSSRAGADDVNIHLSAVQRVLPPRADARKRELDALQAKYPDIPRADLAAQLAERNLRRPPRPHDDFADSDLAIAINESSSQFLRKWSCSGGITLDSAFFASPRLPLRTRMTGVDLSFTDNSVDIDSLSLRSGSSDLHAAGYVTGLRAVTSSRRRGTLEAQMNLESNRLNVNEFVAALQAGKPDLGKVSPEEEKDESFVTDSFEDASLEVKDMPLAVVPGNIRATVGLQVDTVDFAELQIGPALAAVRVQDHTAQILGTHVFTDIGHIGLDGYYATRSKEDITAGANLELTNVDVPSLLTMVKDADKLPPAVRSLQGKLDCHVSATTALDTLMNVIIPSADGLVRVSAHGLEVQDAGKLRLLTRLLLFRNKNIGRIEDFDIDAVIHDSQLEVFPFELGVDRYRLALMGMQGLDRSIYYHASILQAPLPIRFGVNIFGSLDRMRFSLSRAKYRTGQLPTFTRQLDSVQVNIAQGIRDIFRSGVKRVKDYNMALQKERGGLRDEDLLSAEEYAQIDDLLLQAELEDQDEELNHLLDDALTQATRDTDKLMKEYAEQVYDKRILRKMERMNKKQKS